MSDFEFVGKPTPMLDGPAKITGNLKYTGDLRLAGMLHARFVLSDYAHATITHIDCGAALAAPGVRAVLTAEDLPKVVPSARTKLMLARDRVIFVGQPVAIVLAETPAAAADGAELVEIDYEPLTAVTSMDAAVADGAPVIWPTGIPTGAEDEAAHGADTGGESAAEDERPSNIAGKTRRETGDIAAAFAEAAVVVERVFETPMVHQSSIETQGWVVQPNPITGGATMWASLQSPFGARQDVADALGVPESDVTVHGMPVGGAFGAKFGLYEPLVALVAATVGRPVSLILTRSEELLTTNPAPALRLHGKLGFDKDGKLVAMQSNVTADTGVYPSGLGGFAAMQFASFYPCENLLLESTNVITNKQSVGAYRAPTSPTAFMAVETLFDEAAAQLGMDPVGLRLKNAARTGDPAPDGGDFSPIGMVETLEAAKQHPMWQNREAARKQGRGVGLAIGGWMGGLEPGAAVCKLNRDGVLQVQIGTADLSGTPTTFAMLAAETYGVAPDKVRFVYSDTDSAPYGGGVGGSKTTYTLGSAVIRAAQDARRQTFAIAAEEFEVSAEDLEIVDGRVQVRGFPDRSISLGEIAGKAMTFGGRYEPVHGSGRQAITDRAPSFCAQIAEVEVDAETGDVNLLNLAVVQEVGRAINPLAVQGQMQGGAVQGVGWALFEEMRYDDDGQLLSGSWMDYAMPDAAQAAPIHTQIVEVPSRSGPFGARGVGEPPVIPTVAAIANAVAHATGVRMTQAPMTAPRVLAALSSQASV
ncbi:MAG: xanthine dehydrogenase family protein molybdopterin-binding subunit [Chloroflexi bacterium]|nr:xanthine dehydrogenase family protein molybdopterin-binding subunit [Chloroflexota bacterium]MCY4247959.1 xanthine dehydrogenase family protein molybdopterin-binding subunit [Chloroflexota bacterium]